MLTKGGLGDPSSRSRNLLGFRVLGFRVAGLIVINSQTECLKHMDFLRRALEVVM